MGRIRFRRGESASQVAPMGSDGVSVGSRLEIWWEEPYEMFYPGTVAKITKEGIYYVVYDDGDEEWINDLSKEIFRVLPSTPLISQKSDHAACKKAVTGGDKKKEGALPGPLPREKKSMDGKAKGKDSSLKSSSSSSNVSGVVEGSRIEILWHTSDHRGEYYPGTVTKIRAERKKPYYVEYDDGDSGWYSLKRVKFRLLQTEADETEHHGSAVLSEDENEEGLKTKRERSTPSRIMHQLLSTQQDCEQSDEEISSARSGVGEEATEDTASEGPSPSISHKKNHESSQESTCPSTTPPTETDITIGARVEVWWPYYDKFYPGTISQARDDGCHLVIYDDGDRKWHDLRRAKYRALQESIPTQADSQFVAEGDDLLRSDDADLVTIGSRVEVYWEDKGEYQPGNVVRKHKTQDWFYVEYDDGETISGAIDFKELIFCFLPGSKLREKETDNVNTDIPNKNKVQSEPDARISVGSKVEIWWEEDKRYYEAVVSGIRDSEKPHFLQYFDGEEEWVDLEQEKYRLLGKAQESAKAPLRDDSQDSANTNVNSKSSRTSNESNYGETKQWSDVSSLGEGSRIAVWWQEDAQYHSAVIKKTEEGNHTKNFHLEYDEDGEYEILDLRRERFLDMKSREVSSAASTCSGAIFKTPQVSATSKVQELERQSLGRKSTEENQHISGRNENCNSRHLKRNDAVISVDDNQECVGNRKNGRGRPPLKKRRLTADIDSVGNEKESSRSNLAGDTESRMLVGVSAKIAPRTVKEASFNSECSIPVEQIDLQTGAVVATFPSMRQAGAKTGISRKRIQRVLNRKGEPEAGGFFWRRQGDTIVPWASPEKQLRDQRIEKVCLRTAKALKTYDSLSMAAKALRSGQSQIKDVIDGKRASAHGFFWRPAGSDKLPAIWEEMGRQILARRFKDGPVIREFESPLKVAELLGVDCARVCKWARTEKKTYGLYWSFKILPKNLK